MSNYLGGNKTELEHVALQSLFTKAVFGPGIKSLLHLLVQEENGETEAKRKKGNMIHKSLGWEQVRATVIVSLHEVIRAWLTANTKCI